MHTILQNYYNTYVTIDIIMGTCLLLNCYGYVHDIERNIAFH